MDEDWSANLGFFHTTVILQSIPKFQNVSRGVNYILNQLDDIEMIYAEFNAMIEEGMKMSMEDMDDLMDEMRDKMKTFKENGREERLFEEMN